MTKDILNLTKEIMELTNENNSNLTKVFIAYKVVLYCKNNDIVITNEKLLELVVEVYNDVIDNSDSDEYDRAIDFIFKSKMNLTK